jgi:hypothetical protein
MIKPMPGRRRFTQRAADGPLTRGARPTSDALDSKGQHQRHGYFVWISFGSGSGGVKIAGHRAPMRPLAVSLRIDDCDPKPHR